MHQPIEDLEDEARYFGNFQEIGELVPELLVVQDLGGEGIPVSIIARLYREIPVFNWIKIEVQAQSRKFADILEATDGRLGISTAGTQMIEALDRGVRGYMPTVYLDIYSRVMSLYREGNREEARELFYRLLPVLHFYGTHPNVGLSFHKSLLVRLGVFSTARSRQEQAVMDRCERRLMEELIDRAIGILESL